MGSFRYHVGSLGGGRLKQSKNVHDSMYFGVHDGGREDFEIFLKYDSKYKYGKN